MPARASRMLALPNAVELLSVQSVIIRANPWLPPSINHQQSTINLSQRDRRPPAIKQAAASDTQTKSRQDKNFGWIDLVGSFIIASISLLPEMEI